MSGFKWYPGMHALVERAFADALTRTAQDVVDDVERREVVPHAEAATKAGHEAGRLASSVRVIPATSASRGARILWDAPFAAKAYFHPEWDFSRAVHGSARGRWMDDYKQGGEREAYARERYRRHLGLMGVFR